MCENEKYGDKWARLLKGRTGDNTICQTTFVLETILMLLVFEFHICLKPQNVTSRKVLCDLGKSIDEFTSYWVNTRMTVCTLLEYSNYMYDLLMDPYIWGPYYLYTFYYTKLMCLRLKIVSHLHIKPELCVYMISHSYMLY